MASINISSLVLCIFVWMSTAGVVSSFVVDSQRCLAFPPCRCFGISVNCNERNFSTMPKFEVSHVTGSTIYLHLYDNQFTTIPANSFHNLTVSNDTSVHLNLYNNHLNSIATHAFTGIAGAVTHLDLDGNNFITLPSELKTLSNLQTLVLRRNPLLSLNPSAMHSIGRHLQSLYVDLNNFNTWPTELNYLTSLTELYVGYLNMTHLDYDVFHGLVNTLHKLSFWYTQLERIPTAVCHLHNLQSLKFRYNHNVHVNNTLFEPCSRKLTSVTKVDLSGNNLRYMPDVFRSFPSMTRLTIHSNNLSFIEWDTVPSNHSLTFLDMTDNDFTRIPSALIKLQDLVVLNMNNNKITSIEESDLINLSDDSNLLKFSRLVVLLLNDNPIEYISPHAFKDNLLTLNHFQLRDTNLRHLPSSIAGLHSLRKLDLRGSPIECDCDMSFLKSWNVTSVEIDGNCKASSIPIKTYLKVDLPNCP